MTPEAVHALLDWYRASGIDTAEAAEPSDFSTWPKTPFRFQAKSAAPAHQQPQPEITAGPQAPESASTDEAIRAAQSAARAATTIQELSEAIEAFSGCALKDGARKTVVYDGIEKAPLLIIGEAPGRDEDRIGKPFVGRAGQLLDRMLAAIGYSRQLQDGMGDVCITNAIYWRPPGNRTPTNDEKAICLPFVRRFIELSSPTVIVLAGNVPTQSFYPGAPGITRSRGQWREWPVESRTIPVLPIFHPAYLLRSPAQKRLAWEDLKQIKNRLEN